MMCALAYARASVSVCVVCEFVWDSSHHLGHRNFRHLGQSGVVFGLEDAFNGRVEGRQGKIRIIRWCDYAIC